MAEDSTLPSKKGLPLTELRKRGIIDEPAEMYSPKSWLFAAKHCGDQAYLAEDQGRLEDAFVGFLRALGCFEQFTKHKDYPSIKAQGTKYTAYKEMIEFQNLRGDYISRAKSLAEKLKERESEQALTNNGHVSHRNPTQPCTPLSPQTPHTGQSFQSRPLSQSQSQSQDQTSPPNSASTETDTSSGGSIAARMAALRGAGLNVGNGVGGGGNSGSGGGHNGLTSNQPTSPAPSSAGLTGNFTGQSTATAGSAASRRGSIASMHGGGRGGDTNGGGMSGLTPRMGNIGLEGNKTGGSVRSLGGNGGGEHFNHGQAPPTPILAPHESTSGITTPQTEIPNPLAGQSSSTSSTSTTAVTGYGGRNLPSVPTHHHKSSLPNMPTSMSSPGSGYTSGYANRSRNQTYMNGKDTQKQKPTPIQEDEMAHFATAFPSLSEFEQAPEFVDKTSREPEEARLNKSGQGSAFARVRGNVGTRNVLGIETVEDGFSMPRLPSPPRHVPGNDIPNVKLAGNGGPAFEDNRGSHYRRTGGGLSVTELPKRPSSLPSSAVDTGTSPPTSSYSTGLPSGGVNMPFVGRSDPKSPSLPGPRALPSLPPKPLPKPSLPFSNSIVPSRLKEYMRESSLEILIIDTRRYEEYERDWIGKGEGLTRSKTVWLDPTVVMRQGMNAQRLEEALSISPPADQNAFSERDRADLVVIYDESSTSFPSKGSAATVVSTLFTILFETEFRKTLKRSPVLLIGGYKAYKALTGPQLVKGPRPPVPGNKPNLVSIQTTSQSPPKASNRETQVYRAAPPYARNIAENFGGPMPQSMAGPGGNYYGKPLVPASAASAGPSRYESSSPYSTSPNGGPTLPPTASIGPGILARKRSDYAEHHNKPYTGYMGHGPRPSMEYPQVAHSPILQPPPPAAVTPTERQEYRPDFNRSASIISFDGLSKLPASDDMHYWNDVALGISGLKNLGNTCYMNSTLQCLSATYPLARFFRDGSFKKAINTVNPLGTKGDLARAFATLISVLWKESYTFLSPVTFRKSIGQFAPDFAGTDQHDSQEFLSFLLDGLHEDLNRVQKRPPPVEMTPERELALETLPPAVASEKEWRIYKQRNDSLIVDLFQGQYRSRMECLTCHKTSTTYDAFMYMSLPVPTGKSKVVLQQLIDNFVQAEIMENDDAWNCPRCKVPRRATKSLSIARLPPVLLIHLKRFSTKNGVFWDKSETPVIFPVKGLDLTRYLPPSIPQLKGDGRAAASPMATTGPYHFDLFAVSNHMGNLSNGHYTAFVNSSKGWQYCDDSKITPAAERDVITKPAYILFYKRVL